MRTKNGFISFVCFGVFIKQLVTIAFFLECTINWFKDGIGIDESNDRYYINETYLRAEPAVGDFESVLSELHFNLSAWPDQKLDIYKDNANYSCSSTSKTDGPGVRSATYFGVECKC